MNLSRRWIDRTGVRIFLQTGLLTLCYAATFVIHALIAADMLSDVSDLALNLGGLLLLLVACGLSMRAARGARYRALWLAPTALFGLATAFAWSSYPDVSIELASLIVPADAAESPGSIVIGPTGRDVRLSGEIREGAANLLTALLEAHPDVTRIHLTSEGGLAEEGQALGEVIAAHHLTTFVPDFCVSACTLAFVAGRERLLMDGARLGFHAPYEDGILGQTFAGDPKEPRSAYLKAGLARDFIDQALTISPDDMWFPDKDRLVTAHVVTGIVNRYRFPDSLLDGAADLPGARTAIMRNFPVLKTFDTRSPQTVDRIAAWYLNAYRRGASEGDSVEGLKTIVHSVLASIRAGDGALFDCLAIGTGAYPRATEVVLSDRNSDAPPGAASPGGEGVCRGTRAPNPNSNRVTSAEPIAMKSSIVSCAAALVVHDGAMRRRDASESRTPRGMAMEQHAMALPLRARD